MVERVISGGETDAAQAALRAARAAGLPTGGTATKGWATRGGPAPWLADFGLVECDRAGPAARARADLRASDATLWFGDPGSRGGRATLGACRDLGRPCLVVRLRVTPSSAVADWLAERRVRVLHVAGDRDAPDLVGRAAAVEWFLAGVLAMLGTTGVPTSRTVEQAEASRVAAREWLQGLGLLADALADGEVDRWAGLAGGVRRLTSDSPLLRLQFAAGLVCIGRPEPAGSGEYPGCYFASFYPGGGRARMDLTGGGAWERIASSDPRGWHADAEAFLLALVPALFALEHPAP